MVKDFHGAYLSPQAGAAAGGYYYFANGDDEHGIELWKTDGTTTGTALVRDIHDGFASSEPRQLVGCGSRVFFTAYSGISYKELWTSDGTTSGTQCLTHAYQLFNFTDVDGILFFCKRASTSQPYELWKSDGTTSGTAIVRTLASINGLTDIDGALYFTGSDGVNGTELWRSDGTATGTLMVKDIYPGSDGSYPNQMVGLNGAAFFSACDAVQGFVMWKSDGTTAGTVAVRDGADYLSGPFYLRSMDGFVYYMGTGGLWRTNGLPGGTKFVTDHYPYEYSLDGISMTPVGNTLFFSTHDAESTWHTLWATDGTTTSMLKHIDPGSFRYFAAAGGAFYFVADHGAGRQEVWRSDGTTTGTVLVKSFDAGTGDVKNLADFDGTLVFTVARGLEPPELWRSDGTEAGTVPVFTLQTGHCASGMESLLAVGDTMYFSGSAGATTGLWKSDGTETGTVMLKDLKYIYPLAGIGNTVYAILQSGGDSFWRSDGTTTGTLMVKDFSYASGLDESVGDIAAVGNTLYLATSKIFDAEFGLNLWKSDGTTAGTTLVKHLDPPSFQYGLTGLCGLNGMVYFMAADDSHGVELWRSDGTTTGTVMLKDINPGVGDSTPRNFSGMNGRFYFRADDGVHGAELWKSDGTASGTLMVKDITPGSANSSPGNLTPCGDTLYFIAVDASSNQALWRTDGTEDGTVCVKALSPGPTNWALFPGAGNNVYFTEGTEVWTSDGTTSGTRILRTFSFVSQYEGYWAVSHGKVYFEANDGTGTRLWKTDGTERGTAVVQTPGSGCEDLRPGHIKDLNGTLLFSLSDQWNQSTLWRLDVTPPPAPGNPVVTDVASDAMTWQWDCLSDDDDGFKVYAGAGSAAPDAPTSTTLPHEETFTMAGLAPNSQYAMRLAAMNAAGDSAMTETATTWTLAAVPCAPNVCSPTTRGLTLSIGSGDGNPPHTRYAICSAAGGEWVQPDGTLGGAPAWQTAAAWGNVVLACLDANANYRFSARAVNEVGFETINGPEACIATAPIPAAIAKDLAPLTVNPGQAARFSVEATGSAPLWYQWKKDGVNIEGATGCRYGVDAAAYADAGVYSCVVGNAGGTVCSKAVRLAVRPTVTVVTEFGQPMPINGTVAFTTGTVVTVAMPVTNVADATGTTRRVCTGWTAEGAAPGGDGYCVTFVLDRPTTITWQWKTQYRLAASADNAASCTIALAGGTTAADGTWHDAGTTVSINAGVQAGWVLAGWSGDMDGRANPAELLMDRPKAVRARLQRFSAARVWDAYR